MIRIIIIIKWSECSAGEWCAKNNNNYSSRVLCAETIKEIKVKSSNWKLRVVSIIQYYTDGGSSKMDGGGCLSG